MPTPARRWPPWREQRPCKGGNMPSSAKAERIEEEPMAHPVKTQWIDINPGFAGYLALPPAGSGPGLLLFQEIFGVNEHIRGVAEQYALDGFVVLAPDTFWRQAPRVELGYEGDDRQQAMALMKAYAAT